MPEMKLTIVHDKKGNIVAISEVVDLKAAGSNFKEAGIIPGKGQLKLDIEFDEEIATWDVYRLYRVDRATAKLVKLKKPREMPSLMRR
jgi:hypothetical protein